MVKRADGEFQFRRRFSANDRFIGKGVDAETIPETVPHDCRAIGRKLRITPLNPVYQDWQRVYTGERPTADYLLRHHSQPGKRYYQHYDQSFHDSPPP